MFEQLKKMPFFSPVNSEEHLEHSGPFEANIYVQKYLVLTELQAARASPSEAYERDRESLFAKIVRGIKKNRILLEYSPKHPEMVEIPLAEDRLYTQALFYWCAELDLTVPLLIEAAARNGNCGHPRQMTRTIKKIVFEDSVNETDAFFVPQAPDERPSTEADMTELKFK